MDIKRPSQASAKRRKRFIVAGLGLAALGAFTFGIMRLKPAVPSVERSSVWVDTVKRGELLRQVRGLGTLVPEEIRWLAARTAGRVERIVLRPGAQVQEDSVILVLDNPEVKQAAADADSQLKAAEAELINLDVQLERSVLEAESAAANARANFEQAKLRAELNAQLFKDGLVAPLDLKLSQVTAQQAETLDKIEQKRFAFARDSVGPQRAVKEAEVDRLRAQALLRHEELAALQVRAGMRGVLSALPVEVGAQVQPGTNLARVADPTKLKAELRIPETQARDIVIGQTAQVDTRNGVVVGNVARIEPAVQNGTVTVDVTFTEELPRGARPDLSVDGTIELERLADVIYVGRPSAASENRLLSIYRLEPNTGYAHRRPVRVGRASASTVEILEGLQPGDQVVLSDMTQWDGVETLQLK